MPEVGVYEAKSTLPELIKQVLRGEFITITNRGEPVVDLVPSKSRTTQQIQNAIAAIKATRAGSINQAQYNKMRLQGRR